VFYRSSTSTIVFIYHRLRQPSSSSVNIITSSSTVVIRHQDRQPLSSSAIEIIYSRRPSPRSFAVVIRQALLHLSYVFVIHQHYFQRHVISVGFGF